MAHLGRVVPRLRGRRLCFVSFAFQYCYRAVPCSQGVQAFLLSRRYELAPKYLQRMEGCPLRVSAAEDASEGAQRSRPFLPLAECFVCPFTETWVAFSSGGRDLCSGFLGHHLPSHARRQPSTWPFRQSLTASWQFLSQRGLVQPCRTPFAAAASAEHTLKQHCSFLRLSALVFMGA